jgi:NAD+ kinase
VVHPDVGVFIVTPICPHTLNARSLVIPDKERVRIIGDCGEGPSQMMLTVDGQLGEHMLSKDEVEIVSADYLARLVQFEAHSFYTKLQTRMRWGERLSGPKGKG